MAAYVGWQSLRHQDLRPSIPWWLFAGLIITSLVWFVGLMTATALLQQLTLPAMIWLLLAASFGYKAAKSLVVAFVLVYLVIPVWDVLTPYLQGLTVNVNEFLLRQVSVVAHIEGKYVYLPIGVFHIAGGCSGLKYLLVSLTLAVLYAGLHLEGITRPVLLTTIAVLFALLANWIRVFVIIYIGHISEMQSSFVSDHELLGWIIFITAMVPVLLIGSRMRQAPVGNSGLSPPKALQISRSHVWLPIVALSTSLMGVVLAESVNRWYVLDGTIPDFKAQLPNTKVLEVQPWMPIIQNAGTTQAYALGNGQFAYIAYYPKQEQGRELIYYRNVLNADHILKVDAILQIPNVNYSIVEDDLSGKRFIMAYWYAVGNKVTDSELLAKGWQAIEYLFGRTDAALVAVYKVCVSTTCEYEIADLPVDQLRKTYTLAITLARGRS